MSGCIIGAFGFQRSGKTLIQYLKAEEYRVKYNIPVYTNMVVPNWNTIDNLDQIPFDYKPKILFLDELYFFMDSRMFKDNASASIFFTTIGKQNILFLYTAISPDMIEKRIREQTNYMYIVKSDSKNIYYRMLDVQRSKSKDFILEKSTSLFDKVTYDTKQVPNYVNCDLKEFVNRFKKEENQIKNNGGFIRL